MNLEDTILTDEEWNSLENINWRLRRNSSVLEGDLSPEYRKIIENRVREDEEKRERKKVKPHLHFRGGLWWCGNGVYLGHETLIGAYNRWDSGDFLY